MVVISDLVKLIGNFNSQRSGETQLYFSSVDIILYGVFFKFETEMKTALLKVILQNFIEKKYVLTGDFSNNSHCTPTLSIS